MTKAEKIIGSIVLILLLGALFFWKDIRSISRGEAQLFSEQSNEGKKDKKNKKSGNDSEPTATASNPAIKIVEKSELLSL